MDELLAQAAEKLGMPPALAQRSARARAEKEGITVEAVLREWAGQDTGPSDTANESTETETAPDAAATEEPTAPSTGDTPAETAPTEVTTDYLVALASEAKRMPEKLVRSSAEARARNAHTSVDSVLAAASSWPAQSTLPSPYRQLPTHRPPVWWSPARTQHP